MKQLLRYLAYWELGVLCAGILVGSFHPALGFALWIAFAIVAPVWLSLVAFFGLILLGVLQIGLDILNGKPQAF